MKYDFQTNYEYDESTFEETTFGINGTNSTSEGIISHFLFAART